MRTGVRAHRGVRHPGPLHRRRGRLGRHRERARHGPGTRHRIRLPSGHRKLERPERARRREGHVHDADPGASPECRERLGSGRFQRSSLRRRRTRRSTHALLVRIRGNGSVWAEHARRRSARGRGCGDGGARSDLRPDAGHALPLPPAGQEQVARSLRRNADVHDRERLIDHLLRRPTDPPAQRLGTGRALNPAPGPAARPGTERADDIAGAEEDREEGRGVQARREARAWQVRKEKETAGHREAIEPDYKPAKGNKLSAKGQSSKAMKATISSALVACVLLVLAAAPPGARASGNANWGTGVELTAPANAAEDPEAVLREVSCPSAGNCTAVGSYSMPPEHKEEEPRGQGELLSETGGIWEPAVEATMPAGAASSPRPEFGALSC